MYSNNNNIIIIIIIIIIKNTTLFSQIFKIPIFIAFFPFYLKNLILK